MKVTLKYLQCPTPHPPESHPASNPRKAQFSPPERKDTFLCELQYVETLEVCRAYKYANRHKHIARLKCTRKKIGQETLRQIKNINQGSHTGYHMLEL